MKHILQILLLLALPVIAVGQKPTVSANAGAVIVADTLTGSGKRMLQQGDTLHAGVDDQLDGLQEQNKKVQHKIDSLAGLGEGVNQQLQDSLRQVLAKGQALEQKLLEKHQLMSTPLGKVQGMQQQVLPEVDLPAAVLPQKRLPGVDLPSGQLQAMEVPKGQFSADLSQKAALPKDIADFQMPDLPSLKLDSSTFNGGNIDKKLEEQLLKQKEVAVIQEQAGLGQDPLKEYLQMDAKELAQQQAGVSLDDLSQEGIQQQLVEQLPNHSQQLDKARRELSKYNGRFTEIKSLADLPKNPLKRHPLMGVKWYKRLQPGLQWQVGKGDALRIDIGPRISYLVTDKLELGASGQGRATIGKKVPSFVSFDFDRVWGYSLFGSYEIKNGFYGQVSYERLNTQVIKLPNQQERPEEWLWIEGLRLGLGKRYTIYKSLRGFSLMEYNFSPSVHAPYRQELQLKVGIMWDRRYNH